MRELPRQRVRWPRRGDACCEQRRRGSRRGEMTRTPRRRAGTARTRRCISATRSGGSNRTRADPVEVDDCRAGHSCRDERPSSSHSAVDGSRGVPRQHRGNDLDGRVQQTEGGVGLRLGQSAQREQRPNVGDHQSKLHGDRPRDGYAAGWPDVPSSEIVAGHTFEISVRQSDLPRPQRVRARSMNSTGLE